MQIIRKGIVVFLSLFILTSCSKEITNEFQDLYGLDKKIVNRLNYEEFLLFTDSDTGIVFLDDENNSSKDLAKIFCDTLCECDVNKAYFVKREDIIDNQLLEKFEVEELNFPIIVSYKNGKLVGYYDSKTKTENVKKYIDEIIHEAYPSVCTEAC